MEASLLRRLSHSTASTSNTLSSSVPVRCQRSHRAHSHSRQHEAPIASSSGAVSEGVISLCPFPLYAHWLSAAGSESSRYLAEGEVAVGYSAQLQRPSKPETSVLSSQCRARPQATWDRTSLQVELTQTSSNAVTRKEKTGKTRSCRRIGTDQLLEPRVLVSVGIRWRDWQPYAGRFVFIVAVGLWARHG